ncbi:glycoside hydrolase family 32 protein [Paenibacillus sp. MSJ-34]|uniref:glycoside hydrolase family 32 protein n=1 Tax=Paenibacillus sp. MSJ-34 TaxID=2841529 RepID=UPI001C102299|nr:glycoside hydrolase family 32 protein [Paenibacillus sp. MSJ-34]MBU5440923.1 glycoside hydrolase family 32 protein [Paenibacillus sp. MSJ-34]
MNYTKEKADLFIRQNKALLRDDYRLRFHLMSEYGWMNDPNGFIYYKGNYHLFYQHYPYRPYWGPMHWGHAVSRDLVAWEYLPVALAPDRDYDRDGCFSGSAVERDGKLALLYTGHIVTGPDNKNDYMQSQCLALSDDGVHFEKFAGNPVIPVSQIPEGASLKDFRDPKVFERNGCYYTVIGSNDGKERGIVLLYRSADLQQWDFVNIIAQGDSRLGANWECPDLFPLEDRDVLILSPERMPAQGNDYHNGNSTVYMLGRLDTEEGKFRYDSYEPVDCGFDFYAPQTCEDSTGRRIIVGWMENWTTEIPTQQDHHWAGAMTLPREVVVAGDKLHFLPLEEIKRYRLSPYEVTDVELDGERMLECSGDCYELEAVFEALDAEEFGLLLRKQGQEETVVAYRPSEQLVRFNRDRSGIGPQGERRTNVALQNGRLALRIFVDRSSVEVFIQEGEKVMTGRIYPGAQSVGIGVFARGMCRLVSLRKWDIRV